LKFDDGTDFAKTLGLAWDPVSDQLLFSFSVLQSTSSLCRRSVLYAIARFYDPIGLVGPVTTKSNIFLQQLCKEKLSWDESLSHRTRNGVLYVRVLCRLSMRHFLVWFVLQTLRVKFMDFVMPA